MDFNKLFSYITPFTLMALVGLIMIAYGFVHPKQENNALQFIIGVPFMLLFVGLHYLVRWIVSGNTLYVWILEGIAVAFLWYAYPKM